MLANSKLQTIDPEMLPCLPRIDLCDISSGKVDFVFSFSPRSPAIEKVLRQFERQQIPLGLTTDPSLSYTPFFAGIIVRDKSGNFEEARLQLSLLFAAQFEKLTQLGQLEEEDIHECHQPLMLGWTVIGSDWCLYCAYRHMSQGKETMVRLNAIPASNAIDTKPKAYSISKRPLLRYIQTQQPIYTMASSRLLILYTELLHIWKIAIGLSYVIF